MISLELPLAPPANNAYANRRNARGSYGRMKSTRYREWQRQADAHYTFQGFGRVTPISGPYRCKMVFPERVRGDLDGRQKLIIDWLVSRKLVPGDDPKFLRKLESEFGECKLVQITLEDQI